MDKCCGPQDILQIFTDCSYLYTCTMIENKLIANNWTVGCYFLNWKQNLWKKNLLIGSHDSSTSGAAIKSTDILLHYFFIPEKKTRKKNNCNESSAWERNWL